MKIESIVMYKKNNPNIFAVTIDGIPTILHADIIVEFGLCTGEDISQERLNTAQHKSDLRIATDKAIKYVSSRLKTTKQLKDYLVGKKYSETIIEEVIAKLLEYKIISDEIYATALVKSNKSVRSKRYIQNKLYTCGVNKQIIAETTEECDDSVAAITLATKFFSVNNPDDKNVQKLIRQLQYKGFGWDSIKEALKSVNKESICE